MLEITWLISALVIPLYGLMGGMLWKISNLKVETGSVSDNEEEIGSNTEQIDENAEAVMSLTSDIRDLCRKIDHLTARISQLEQNQKTIHDLIAQQNHCGADECTWCVGEKDKPEEHEPDP